jgi:hypothetical protein
MVDYTLEKPATMATLRDVELYWQDRIRNLEDDTRRQERTFQERMHRLETQLAEMKRRWPGGWSTA